MNRLREKSSLPLLLSLAFFCVQTMLNLYAVWTQGTALSRGEASAGVMLPLYLDRGYRTLPADWYTADGAGLFHGNLFYRIGTALSGGSWQMASLIACILGMLLLTVASCYLMMAAGLAKYRWWLAFALLCPVGPFYGWNVIYHGYETMQIVWLMTTYALQLHLQRLQRGRTYLLLMLAQLTVAFVSGMWTFAGLFVCYVPLFLATLLCRPSEAKEDGLPALLRGALLPAASALLAYGAGFLVRVLTGAFNRYASLWGSFSFSSVMTRISDLVGLLGWGEGAPIMSIRGVAGLVSLLLVLFVILSFYVLYKKRAELSREMRVLSAAVLCALLIQLFFFSGIKEYHLSCLFPFVPFLYVVVLAGHTQCREGVYHACYAVLALMLLLSGFMTMRAPHMSYAKDETLLKNITSWLYGNGYTEGASPVWYSGAVEELSGGEITMWTMENYTLPDSYLWAEEARAEGHLPKGSFFLLVPVKDTQAVPLNREEMQSRVVFGDAVFYVYHFNGIDEYLEVMR